MEVRSPHGNGELLERDSERGALREELDLAVMGDGRLVTIEGPPGIGKTRLVAEAVALAREQAVLCLRARGSPLERGLPYGGVRQLFAPLVRDERLSAALLGGRAEAARPLFEGDAAPGGESEGAFQVLNGLLWLTINLCEQRPAMLAVDDAQWVDAPSQRFLSYVARRLDGIRALVVVAHRSGGIGVDASPEESALASLDHRALHPKPLSEQGSAGVLRASLGELADAQFCRACHRSSGGNPLLLRELVRTLEARGIEPVADQVEALSDLGQEAVARTVAVRLAQLPPEASRLVEAAAVLGEKVALRHAAELAGLKADEAARTVEELRRMELLGPGATIAFVHPLVRDTLRSGLDPLAAERAHADAARILEHAGAPDELVAEQLLHTPPAGDGDRLATLRRAARDPISAGDGAAAAPYLRRALAEPPPDAERAAVLVELASAEELFDGEAAIAHLEEAMVLIDDPVTRAAAAARVAALYPSVRPEAATGVGLEAAEMLGDAEPELRRVLLAIAGTGAATRSPAGITPELLAALRAEVDSDGAGSRMLACVLAYREVWHNVPAAEILPRAELAFEGDWQAALAITGAPFTMGVLSLLAADSVVAPRAIEEWFVQARRQGSLAKLSGGMMFRAHLHLLRGELDDAAEDAEDALEAMEAWGMSGAAVGYAAAALAEVCLERDDLEGAAAAIARGGATDREAGDVGLHGLLACRARLRAANGEARVALNETIELGSRFEELEGRNPGLLPWRSRAAGLLAELDEADRARSLAEEEIELAREWGTPRAIGRALAAAGAVTEGPPGVARLEEAVVVLDEAPAPLEQVRARVALGGALDRAGASAEAREPLRRALEIAGQRGAAALESRARRGLIAAGGRPRRATAGGPAALTARERRVAELAAGGAANREIAEELYLTPRTVENHLSNAYRKLGIGSRTELPDTLG